ncbi:MAG: hypothetical protein H7333_02065 [Bdellovibrionales bacterium]|nr:hypothetical protein [Oligoflexia bacterium]
MSTRVSDFSIEVPGKWVLTGEHSVLRGKSAIAFCHPTFSLKLSYREQETQNINPNPFQSQIKQLIGRALEFLKLPAQAFSGGNIDIQSQIPIGAGLGSSAAVCVAMARLVLWKTSSDLKLWIPLATHLEDVFHGKSSGMDVSAIALSHPILFSMENKGQVLKELEKFPRFEFYDSGKRGLTKECIEVVKHWRANNPDQRDALDDEMQSATEAALKGLQLYQTNARAGEAQVASAMAQAQYCFETWGLVSPELLFQKEDLLKQGALAVKLTGAGLGGFWVALWPTGSG